MKSAKCRIGRSFANSSATTSLPSPSGVSSMNASCSTALAGLALAFALFVPLIPAQDPPAAPKAFIDGTGLGWKQLTGDDFVNVNCDKDTWTWNGGDVHCTGQPIGVTRTKTQYVNFELVAEWRHLKFAGNSGIFVWTPEHDLKMLKRGA